ncbi:hypothetical protein HDU67_005851, partial [Dinochytrium kinnereticum]
MLNALAPTSDAMLQILFLLVVYGLLKLSPLAILKAAISLLETRCLTKKSNASKHADIVLTFLNVIPGGPFAQDIH